MSDESSPAAFTGSLVNLKNVATHKAVALTIEVPEEYAAALIAAFGWPTRVRPVPVAIAKLASEAVPEQPQEKKKEHWSEMAPSKQAAILCQEKDFQEFLAAQDEWDAAHLVRTRCYVDSRRDIRRDEYSGRQWAELMIEYGAWLREKRGGR